MSAGLVVMMLSICTERGGGVRSKVDRWWEVLEWIYRSRWQGQRCVEGQPGSEGRQVPRFRRESGALGSSGLQASGLGKSVCTDDERGSKRTCSRYL